MKQADIIVLSGQSNAVGVGHAEYLPRHFSAEMIAKWKKGYDRIKINYFSHDKKSNGFVPTTIGCTEASKNTVGPELGIADALDEKYPGREFFIVKCAFGGMSLYRDFLSPSGGSEYDPEAYADQIDDIIVNSERGAAIRPGWSYNELVKITRESIDILKAQGYVPEIRAFCWMQGEADSITWEHSERYIGLYGHMISDFKNEFAEYTENCVFVDAAIHELWTFREKINAEKEKFAASRPDCVYIDTVAKGLTCKKEPEGNVDIYHYDSDSVIELGRLFAGGTGL
ncbi:MAG: hypothetical protein IKX06_03155 [Clostridia bacterium]|nr:hypothetical protein [Clostridia bacterium]